MSYQFVDCSPYGFFVYFGNFTTYRCRSFSPESFFELNERFEQTKRRFVKNDCAWFFRQFGQSIARPDSLFITDLQEKFQTAGIEVENSNLGQLPETTWFHYPSDYLGDIVHSLNVRSDNLYAESVLRLLSLSAHEKGSAEKGIDIIRKYWQNYEADRKSVV